MRDKLGSDFFSAARRDKPGYRGLEFPARERKIRRREERVDFDAGSRSTDDKSSAAGRSMYAIDSPLHAPPRPRHRTNLSPTLLFRERSLNSFQANLRRDRETRMTNRWRATSRGILNARRGFQLTGAIAYKAGPDSFVD